MIIETRTGNVHNPEGVKYVIPSGFCSVAAYLFYNHINPSDFNCVTHKINKRLQNFQTGEV